MNCYNCHDESGDHVICSFCRKRFRSLSKDKQKKINIEWHKHIIQKGECQGLYRCRHCKKLFPWDEITGDHYPRTKAADPENRFNINAGVPSCKICNNGMGERLIP